MLTLFSSNNDKWLHCIQFSILCQLVVTDSEITPFLLYIIPLFCRCSSDFCTWFLVSKYWSWQEAIHDCSRLSSLSPFLSKKMWSIVERKSKNINCEKRKDTDKILSRRKKGESPTKPTIQQSKPRQRSRQLTDVPAHFVKQVFTIRWIIFNRN